MLFENLEKTFRKRGAGAAANRNAASMFQHSVGGAMRRKDMFYSLTGKFIHRARDGGDRCGQGWLSKCFTSMNTLRHLPRAGMEKATLYTHLNVREDAGPVRVYDTGGAQLL